MTRTSQIYLHIFASRSAQDAYRRMGLHVRAIEGDYKANVEGPVFVFCLFSGLYLFKRNSSSQALNDLIPPKYTAVLITALAQYEATLCCAFHTF